MFRPVLRPAARVKKVAWVSRSIACWTMMRREGTTEATMPPLICLGDTLYSSRIPLNRRAYSSAVLRRSVPQRLVKRSVSFSYPPSTMSLFPMSMASTMLAPPYLFLVAGLLALLYPFWVGFANRLALTFIETSAAGRFKFCGAEGEPRSVKKTCRGQVFSVGPACQQAGRRFG